MLTLNEAVDRVASSVLRKHADELVRVYLAHPTYTTKQPRKTLCSMVSHAIGMKITEEIHSIRKEGIYPLAIENMPAIRRVERKVFDGILQRTR